MDANRDTKHEENTRTALIAEDDELIREIVTVYLERLGYRVLEAKNGQIAVGIIQQLGPSQLDLIVTDLLMPKAGGEAVIEAARKIDACHRFLVMSGFAPDMSREVSEKAANSRFLAKPFTFDAFEATVGELSNIAS